MVDIYVISRVIKTYISDFIIYDYVGYLTIYTADAAFSLELELHREQRRD